MLLSPANRIHFFVVRNTNFPFHPVVKPVAKSLFHTDSPGLLNPGAALAFL